MQCHFTQTALDDVRRYLATCVWVEGHRESLYLLWYLTQARQVPNGKLPCFTPYTLQRSLYDVLVLLGLIATP